MGRDHPVVYIGASVAIFAAVIVAVVTDDTSLRVGLFGLIGTVIGALGTFVATERAARGDLLARKRAAGRLLQEDLAFARTRCDMAGKNRRFWASRFDLRLDGWERYRETVAQELRDTGEWQTVAAAFEAMRTLQSKCDALRGSGNTERPRIGPRSEKAIQLYMERSDNALNALRHLSGDRPRDEVAGDDDEA